jgi:hypothetical protein
MKGGDIATMGVVVVAFAVLVTVHIWIVIGLFSRAPKWRGAVALIVAPLAPYWALRERMVGRGVTWLLSAVAYIVAFELAKSG